MANAAITIDLNAKIANFETELKRATGTLDRFEKKGSAALATFKSFGAGLVGALSVGAITSFAKAGIDAADALNDMSQRLGVSVKDLASFKLAAEQSGTSLDGVGAGIARLTRSIGEAEGGNKKLAAALGALGITARDPKEAFFQLADAVERIQDPSERAALLSQVLGKSYQDLIPLLVQGGAALRESARQSETFADAMARLAPQADQFNDQLALLKNNVAGLAATVLSKLVPSFNEWIAVGQEVVKTGSLLDKVRFFALGNASDEMVGRVRKMAAESAAAAKKAREAIGKIDAPIARAQPARKTRAVARVASDPLAGLLGQTDIGRMAAFDKQVALLNARFDGGRKNTELYTQAMTKLVETTFSNNFTEFNKQLADQDETQRLVADHLKATNDALFEQQQAWADAGSALTDEMRTPLEAANIEFGRLQDLLDRGVISWETYTRAVLKTQDAISDTPAKLKEMDNFAKTAAENIQNSFADFLFDPFDKGLKGMAQGFGDTIKRMIANAVAADLAKKLFGGLADNGSTSGSGLAGSALNWIGSLFGGARAEGGPVTGGVPYLVGERGPEMFVPQGNGSIVPNKVMKGGGHTIIVNVNGSNNAPDVRRAAGQGAREALGLFDGARRYV
jgi:hypothetical protein